MKNFSKKSFVGPLFLVFILLTTSYDVHTKPAAPPSGGVAGDPSRITCAFPGCHPAPENVFVAGDYDLNFGTAQATVTPMIGQTYTPGQTYYIEFKPLLTNGNATHYGFQMTSLDAAGNMAGAFTITDATHNSAQSLLSRNYIGHKNANTFNDWVFQWTAPATDVGPITFYYTSDIADGDGNESGDHIYKGTTSLSAEPNGLKPVNTEVQQLSIYPNPVKDFMMIYFAHQSVSTAQLSLFTIDGRRVENETKNISPYATTGLQYNVPAAIVPGIYLLEVKIGNSKSVRRIVLQ